MDSRQYPQPTLAQPDSPPPLAEGPRTFVIGDVHGCADELHSLLEKIGPGRGDRVVFVGDLLDRGPHARRVFDLLRQVNGELVLGNHEDKFLRWAAQREGFDPATGPVASEAGQPSARKIELAPHHHETLAELRAEDWNTMRAGRRYIKLPEHDCVVVHAGLRPGLPLDLQDGDDLCRLHRIGRTGRRRRYHTEGAVFWASVCDHPAWVIYGHTHFPEPVRFERTLGIDTGCCFGGSLTALELPAWRLHQVKARRNYMSEMMRRLYPVRA